MIIGNYLRSAVLLSALTLTACGEMSARVLGGSEGHQVLASVAAKADAVTRSVEQQTQTDSAVVAPADQMTQTSAPPVVPTAVAPVANDFSSIFARMESRILAGIAVVEDLIADVKAMTFAPGEQGLENARDQVLVHLEARLERLKQMQAFVARLKTFLQAHAIQPANSMQGGVSGTSSITIQRRRH